MAKQEWVCGNCYAQNPCAAETCRVCGLAAPEKTVIRRKMPPEPEPMPLPVPEPAPEETGVTRAQSIARALANAYRIVTVVWAALVAHTGTLLILSVPVWMLSQRQFILPNVHRLAGFPVEFAKMLERGVGRLAARAPLPLLKTLAFPFSGVGAWTGWRLLLDPGILALMLTVLWTARLTLRTLACAQSNQKRCRRSMLKLPLEALALNLIFSALLGAGGGRYSAVATGFTLTSWAVLASLFAMQTLGIALALAALIAWMVAHRDWIESGSVTPAFIRGYRHHEIFDKRPLRAELLTGVAALLVFAALAVALSMAAFL